MIILVGYVFYSNYIKNDFYDTDEIISKTDTKKIDSDNYKMLDINNIDQKDGYPTGCESVSAVMIMQYLGIDISVEDFIDNYLEMGKLKVKNKKLYGPSPYDKYVGNPKTKNGYGCFAKVIVKAANNALPKTFEAKDISGAKLKDIVTDYIENDIPVMMWATINMTTPGVGDTWLLNKTNEKYTWPAGEHCMVLVGYDNDNYYFNDPYNNALESYSKDIVKTIYNEMGSQAAVILRR